MNMMMTPGDGKAKNKMEAQSIYRREYGVLYPIAVEALVRVK